MNERFDKPLELSDDEKALLITKKATCPFIGSAIAESALPVRNTVNAPLASIENVRTLGNTGGGDLGDLLVHFASGNHAKMRDGSGKLNTPVPEGLFSLDFPGSQGSHPGHSGILEGSPELLDSGRLSEADFARLISRTRNGYVKRSDVGCFIAENLYRDPDSKVFMKEAIALLGGDLVELVETTGSHFLNKLNGSGDKVNHREIDQKLTKLAGENNLVGSAGEFGLLFAFFANKPGAHKIDGEPALSEQDLRAMFVDKRLPDGWETWKKTRKDWAKNTAALVIIAGKEYQTLMKRQ